MRCSEYKGYNKELQEKVFCGSRTWMDVTLIALVRHRSSLAVAHRPKEFGMEQKSFLYKHPRNYRSKWFIVRP
jgi:hypothetical protein